MDIKIYTAPGCQYCAAAIRLLRKRGVAFREVALNGDPALIDDLEKRTRQRTTPQIFVDGEHLGGFDELVELDQEGKLA